MAALLSHGAGAGHGTAANGATDPTTHATSKAPSATPSAAALGRATASARPSPAACLTGTWRAVDQQFNASINGQQTLFTGSGAIATLRSDGTSTTAYHDTVFSADVNGVECTQTFQGSSAGHWAVRNGDILFSAVSTTGTVVLRDDGVVNTLREYFTNGGDDELARETGR